MHALILTLAVIAAVFLIEMICTGVEHSSFLPMVRRLGTSQWADVFCFLSYGTGFFEKTILLGSFGISALLVREAHQVIGTLCLTDFRLDLGHDFANLAAYYCSYSFISYWNHRFFHGGVWWNFHRFHHSATDMNPLVEHRNHPFQHAMAGALFAFPLALINVKPEYLAGLGVANQFHQLIQHSNIKSGWGWFGRFVLVSPLAHRIHHSINPLHYNKNFSGELVIWDRLFGTYYAAFDEVGDIGVIGVEYNRHGPIYDILADYGRAAAQCVTMAKDVWYRTCNRVSRPPRDVL